MSPTLFLLLSLTLTNETAATDTTAVSTKPEPVGVAECDEFLDQYQACVDQHVSGEAQASFTASMNQWRDTWRQLAKDPATRETLATMCPQTKEQVKNAMAAYNCDW